MEAVGHEQLSLSGDIGANTCGTVEIQVGERILGGYTDDGIGVVNQGLARIRGGIFAAGSLKGSHNDDVSGRILSYQTVEEMVTRADERVGGAVSPGTEGDVPVAVVIGAAENQYQICIVSHAVKAVYKGTAAIVSSNLTGKAGSADAVISNLAGAYQPTENILINMLGRRYAYSLGNAVAQYVDDFVLQIHNVVPFTYNIYGIFYTNGICVGGMSLLQPPLLSRPNVQNGGLGFDVDDLTTQDHIDQLFQGNLDNFQKLILVGIALTGYHIFGQIDVDDFGQERGRGG
jgi:hypothetical protein